MNKVTILGVLAFVLAWGLLGSLERKSDVIATMSSTCNASYNTIDGALENHCSNLIDQVQSEGYEVLTDNHGSFWAEK